MSGVSFQILGTISAELSRENDTYLVKILEKDKPIFVRECPTPPWRSPKIQSDIISASYELMNSDSRPDKAKYKIKFQERFVALHEQLEHAPEKERALVSETVERLIRLTESVKVFVSEHTSTEVAINNKRLVFSSEEMASTNPRILKTKWWNEFAEILVVSRDDWEDLCSYWVSIAEKVEGAEPETEIDLLTEALKEFLCDEIDVFCDPERINSTEYGFFDENRNEVLVPSSEIYKFLQKNKAENKRELLAKELLKTGVLTRHSLIKRFANLRAGAKRYWSFSSDFVAFRIDSGSTPKMVLPEMTPGEEGAFL